MGLDGQHCYGKHYNSRPISHSRKKAVDLHEKLNTLGDTEGEGLMDAYFAVSMKHLNRYVNENKINIVPPNDLIDGLAFRRGIDNSTEELININLHNDAFGRWVWADQGGALARIGRVNKVSYTEEGNGVRAEAYAYVGSKPATYLMSRHSSRLGDPIFGVDDQFEEEYGEHFRSIASPQDSNKQQEQRTGIDSVYNPDTCILVLHRTVLRRSGYSGQDISRCVAVRPETQLAEGVLRLDLRTQMHQIQGEQKIFEWFEKSF